MIIFVIFFIAGIFGKLIFGDKLTDTIIDQCVAHLDHADLDSIYKFIINQNDFTDYCFQLYFIHASTHLPVFLSVILLNSLWIFLALKVSCRLLFLPFRLPRNLLSIYMMFPLSLFGILPFSFRDSYLLGLTILSLAAFALIIERPFSISLWLYISILLILIARSRLELLPILIVCLILSWVITRYTTLTLNRLVFNTLDRFRKLFTSLRFKLSIPKRLNSRIIAIYLSIAVISAAIAPKALDYMMSRLISTNDATDILSKVFDYQVNRISRGIDSGSATDVLAPDEFANATFEKRFTLQLLNNIFTPLKIFPVAWPKLLALADSFAFITLWFFLLRQYFRISKSFNQYEHSSRLNRPIVFQCWSIITLLAFSVIISNGGNAFRYKSFWAVPLTLGLASELHIYKKR